MANHQEQQQHEKKKMDHFSHKHPLTLIEIKDEEEEMSKSEHNRSFIRCYGCTEKIGTGVPYYRCEEDCPLFCLHHACAHLPTTIKGRHSLSNGCEMDVLQLKERFHQNHEACRVCKKDWYSFAYVCSVCQDGIDIRCAAIRPNEAKHTFHQHPVKPYVSPEKDNLICFVCTRMLTRFESYDFCLSYRCNYCNFFVHPECTDVPLLFNTSSHPHQLRLHFNYVGSKICKICKEEIDQSTQWAYQCPECQDFYIHAANDRCLTSTVRKGDLQHPNHDHPLSLVDEQEAGDDHSIAPADCHCCRQKISSSVPYYTCIHCNKYHLHQLCAHLPQEIEHPLHPKCPLILFSALSVACDVCDQIIDGFTYCCSPCNFDLDIGCALRTHKVKKMFHTHPLFLSHTKAPFSCHACDRDTEGSSYQCTSCQFWVHEQCASLSTSKDKSSHQKGYEHHHDLELVCTIPEKYSGLVVYCRICTKPLKHNRWAYHCNQCRYLTHIHDCSDPQREFGDGVTINPSEVVHLPLAGEPILEEEVRNGIMTKHHRQPMILFADQFESNTIDITPSFLNLIRGSATWPSFHVDGKDYSGTTFSFHNNILTMQANPHVLECTFIGSSTWCHACEEFFYGRGFKCTTCSFTMDTYCALLPRIIKHKYDKHGFSLTYSSIEGIEEYVCEICEEDVTPRYFYHCEPCDQSIHARCIWRAYVQFQPSYEIHRIRELGFLVPPSEDLPQCIVCDQKEMFGHGFAFVGIKNDKMFVVHLTCLSQDDVQT